MKVSESTLRNFGELLAKKTPEKKIFSYGTVHIVDGQKMVKIDGSGENVYTPIDILMDCEAGDRVSVEIINHKVVVNGNITSPASGRGASDFVNFAGQGDNTGMIFGEPGRTSYIFLKQLKDSQSQAKAARTSIGASDEKLYICDKNGKIICEFTGDTVSVKSNNFTFNGKNVATETDISSVNLDLANISTTANSANTKADNAISTANSANTKADNAISTANSANTKADSANTKADSANTKADNAITTANSANTKADNVAGKFNSNGVLPVSNGGTDSNNVWDAWKTLVQGSANWLEKDFNDDFRALFKFDNDNFGYLKTFRCDEANAKEWLYRYGVAMVFGLGTTGTYICADPFNKKMIVGGIQYNKIKWFGEIAFKDDIKTAITDFIYLNSLSWIQSTQGKYYAYIDNLSNISNLNEIISVNISDWRGLNSDIFIQPFIGSTMKNIGLMSNTISFHPYASIILVYIYR